MYILQKDIFKTLNPKKVNITYKIVYLIIFTATKNIHFKKSLNIIKTAIILINIGGIRIKQRFENNLKKTFSEYVVVMYS